ncbi:ANTAR domain-containing protein [Streptomyces sp. NBC_00289]|uniref:ANTAR domain-containing protein n=1 Tax=Streptomyces sp. NBC_00289 TaxID=2975703 RepID=UPI003250CCB7
MTTSRDLQPVSDDTVEGLREEIAQLRQAIGSHAVVDQAIGFLTAVYRLPPAAGLEVLREVSQHTDIRLLTVADTVITWALGVPTPQAVDA